MLSSLALFAQGERGTFNGTVSDPSNAVIGGATVKAVNTATNIETSVTTTDAGVFRMPYLLPGTYKISVSAPGFKGAVRENVILSVAQTLTVDFRLEVGQITDSVTVSSEPPLLETGTAEIGSYVTKKEFDTWPITVGDGRRQIQQFIFSSLPGTTGGTFQGGINGGQTYSHEILVDGIALGRWDLQGGSNNEFSPSAETVSQFKLQTGTVGSEYTGGQTAVANFATKSGGNDVHGSGYWYVQNDALRANGWGNNAARVKRQPFKQHNYGYSIGGPVYLPKVYNGKNRTFFFHNVEKTRVRDFRSTTFTQLPTPDFKQGNFARLLNPAFTGNAGSGTMVGTDAAGRSVQFGAIYDPNTTRTVNGTAVRDIFPGNIVPRSRFSPVASKILELAPIDDPLLDQMLNNMPSLGTCCPFFDETMLLVRIDHQFSQNHRAFASYNRNFRERNNSPGGRWGVPPGSPTNVYQLQNTPGTMVRVSYDWTVNPTILNHLAVGYNRFGNLNESVYVDQDWPSKIGMQNVPGTHFPRLTFSGQPYQGANIGAGGLGSASRGGSYNGSTIVTDNLTMIRSRHNFKMGFEIRKYYQNSRTKSGSGDFNFSNIQTELPGFRNQTGHSFASFLLGAANTISRTVESSNFGGRVQQTGIYFGDDFKVNKKLTLNLGLRWEIIGGMYEVAGRMSNIGFVPNPGAGGIPGALVWADDLGRKGFQDTYWKMISPKFGFAYALNDKMVMRGGYGINNSPPGTNFAGFGGTAGYNAGIARNSGNTQLAFASDPVFYLQDRFPDLTTPLPNKNPALQNGQGVTYIPRDSSRVPYTQNWNFGIQFQLPASSVLELNYIGNKGTRLAARGLDNLNQLPVSALSRGDQLIQPWNAASGVPAPFAGFAGTIGQALRPFPQYTGLGQYQAYFGTSLYNGLQATYTRHFRNGFSILGAYTWSKTLGFADSVFDAEGAQDVNNRGLERAISAFNFPHYAKLTWIYELPIGNSAFLRVPGLAGRILGGWQLTGNHQFRSGAPLGISSSSISSPIFNGTVRPDLVLGQTIVSNPNAQKMFGGNGPDVYLNRAAFAEQPKTGNNVVSRLGTAPPLLPNIRGPHFVGEDLGISKAFKIDPEGVRSVELRGTFINPFNRVGRGNPVTNLADPNFGKILGAQQGGRNIEIALRLTF
ncbi:MAG: TonB-dependent receptor [Bryobacterales bacterium]|nr:TonB-dependent receptor [Bryobacterales bacterium]